MTNQNKINSTFKRNGSLSGKKLVEYIPSMIITNLSTLLLITVDGLVAGNFCGKESLSSINIFYPISVLLGVISMIISVGISTLLSTTIGSQDKENLQSIKKVSFWLMIFVAIGVSIIQIPIVYLIIRSYQLAEELTKLVWQYAIGLMLASPLGLISCCGTYELQIVGKVKILMFLSVIEGLVNLVLDLLFVGFFHLGVAGAGFGTLGANIIRCTLTLVLLYKKTTIFQFKNAKFEKKFIGEILKLGLPASTKSLMSALQGYFLMLILVRAFGSDGGVIKGICAFSFSLANVFSSGIVSSARPLAGLYAGAKDNDGLEILIRQALAIMFISTLLFTILFEFFPTVPYFLHGVKEIPDGGILSLRLFVLCFITEGFNTLFLLYLVNRKDATFATILTLVGNLTLPLFAFLLMKFCPSPYIWLSYLISENITLLLNLARYLTWKKKEKKEKELNKDLLHLSLTVYPEQAVNASQEIRNFAKEHGISERIGYRVALCMEEMVGYIKSTKKSKKTNIQISILFQGKNEATFIIMDDGVFVDLEKNSESKTLVTDNYELLKKIATNIKYEYILNMNYSIFYFKDDKQG